VTDKSMKNAGKWSWLGAIFFLCTLYIIRHISACEVQLIQIKSPFLVGAPEEILLSQDLEAQKRKIHMSHFLLI